MQYRFAQEQQDYSDFAAGRVFQSAPGRPAFPLRLASEIFQRCLALRQAQGETGPCVLYDPCCGSGYLLSTLAYFHWQALRLVIGSDVDAEALRLAEYNLALLTLAGLDRRIAKIEQMLVLYSKESHAEALNSAHHLRDRLEKLADHHPIAGRLFQADATSAQDLSRNLGPQQVDVVICDVPYGQKTFWKIETGTETPDGGPLWQLLEALHPVLAASAVVAIVTDKGQKVAHKAYQRAEHFQLGKRRITLLAPAA